MKTMVMFLISIINVVLWVLLIKLNESNQRNVVIIGILITSSVLYVRRDSKNYFVEGLKFLSKGGK